MTPTDAGPSGDGPSDPALAELARAYGVATDYWDWQGHHIDVARQTIVAVLAAMGVDASTPEATQAALREQRHQRWRRMLPPCLVMREGWTPWFPVHVKHGQDVSVRIELEDGTVRQDVRQQEQWVEPESVDGRMVGEATFEVPHGLPLGYHRIVARSGDQEASSPLIVTPRWVGLPEERVGNRQWGVALQLYSVASERSWGVGDLQDLVDLTAWGGQSLGVGFVLVNPLHAAEPTTPMEPSPYLPSTRRFVNPLYARVEAIPEFAYLSEADHVVVAGLRSRCQASAAASERIDRDVAWEAKKAALRLIHSVPLSPAREIAKRAFIDGEGQGLVDFAVWCALAEEYGPRLDQWPHAMRDPRTPEVADYAAQHRDEVDFYVWLQWVCDEQLGAVAATARDTDMALGLMTDLAVGVHPQGADAWALGDVMASGITVGAPPDAFNQTGQNWSQPPWRPDALAETGYVPYRDLLRTALRHSGGLRVDHIIGLFRLWWIPEDAEPSAGTYVRYDHEALVGILALEAVRAGAVLVGEDLGTVEPWVRDYLAERGILGTSVLWFERDQEGRPLPPERWRELCLATVTTHDLPPSAGYLAGDHVRLRHDLGLLTRSLDEELAVDEQDRQTWLDEVRRRGLLPPNATEQQTVEALHRVLNAAPSRLLAVSLTDMVGDRRTQNQPGTEDEYPNWRVRLAGPDGAAMTLADVMGSHRVESLAQVFRVG